MKSKWCLLLLSAVLVACTENGLLFHSNGKDYVMRDANGIYKIDDKYQVNGIWYQPREDYKYKEVGIASWYGPDFHKGSTANGETYNMYQMTAAHKTLPLPSIVKITNLENGKTAVVRVNDRGPFINNRIIDVSKAAAEKLGFLQSGTAKVRVEIMEEESKALKKVILDNGGKIVGGAPIPDEVPQDIQEDIQPQDIELNNGFQATLLPEETMIDPIEENKPIFEPKKKEPEIKKIPVQKGFFLQMGAFKNYENALALKKKFASSYDNINIVSLPQEQGTIYRVRIGPFAEPTTAVQTMDNIKAATGYDDMRLVEEK